MQNLTTNSNLIVTHIKRTPSGVLFCILDSIKYTYERLEYKLIIHGVTYYIIKIIKANDGYVVESSACTYFMWIVNISKGKTYSIGVDTY